MSLFVNLADAIAIFLQGLMSKPPRDTSRGADDEIAEFVLSFQRQLLDTDGTSTKTLQVGRVLLIVTTEDDLPHQLGAALVYTDRTRGWKFFAKSSFAIDIKEIAATVDGALAVIDGRHES